MIRFLMSAMLATAFLTINPVAQATETAPPAQATAVDPTVIPVAAAPAKKNAVSSFFDKLFNRVLGEKGQPDPSKTMIAPFAADTLPAQAAQNGMNPLPVNNTNLDQPHRSGADLAKWLEQALAEALSFSATNYDYHLTRLARGFSDAGLNEFKTWASATGILNALQSNGLQLNGFVSDPPFLLNEGVVAGRYRWLYEVPVMVSFIPAGSTTYRGQEGIDTRRLIVTLQIGRVAQSMLPDQVVIESWSVKDNIRRN